MNIVCVYHGGCVDGTASASVLLRAFPHAQCFPLTNNYTQKDISRIREVLKHATIVYMLDYTTALVDIVACTSCDIVVIDHHVGAQQDVFAVTQKYPRVKYVYDVNLSGATLTWKHFFPGKTTPKVLRYVQDIDTWQNHYGAQARAVHTRLSLERDNPKAMLSCFMRPAKHLEKEGEILVRFTESQVAEDFVQRVYQVAWGEGVVVLANASQNISVLGNLFAEMHGVPAGIYRVQGKDVRISFRSTEACHTTALDSARMWGGGGHTHASGCSVPLRDFLHILQTGVLQE